MDEKKLRERILLLLDQIHSSGGNIEMSARIPLTVQYEFLKEVMNRLQDDLDHHTCS